MSEYAIIDRKNVFYTGPFLEMRDIWRKVDPHSDLYVAEAVGEYFPDGWDGDIMFVEILTHIKK